MEPLVHSVCPNPHCPYLFIDVTSQMSPQKLRDILGAGKTDQPWLYTSSIVFSCGYVPQYLKHERLY